MSLAPSSPSLSASGCVSFVTDSFLLPCGGRKRSFAVRKDGGTGDFERCPGLSATNEDGCRIPFRGLIPVSEGTERSFGWRTSSSSAIPRIWGKSDAFVAIGSIGLASISASSSSVSEASLPSSPACASAGCWKPSASLAAVEGPSRPVKDRRWTSPPTAVNVALLEE